MVDAETTSSGAVAPSQLDERFFRTFFDEAHEAVFIVDPERDRILDANPRACVMLGYQRAELLGIPMSTIHPHEVPKLRAFMEVVSAQGRSHTDELTCTTRDGALLNVEISAAAVHLGGRPGVIALVHDISRRERLRRQNAYLSDELRRRARFGSIIGHSAGLKKVIEQISIVAATEASVLVLGESGTGKELVARAIHDGSARRAHPLVSVNCPAIPAGLFESEFFGHARGAFTGALEDRAGRFELADGSTLFLDEIGEIPLELQGKLLRVLQEQQLERVGEGRSRKVDVRIIAASNRDLLADVRAGLFRRDLYYRLSVFPIEIPPLRERREDIAALAEHYLAIFRRRAGQAPTRLGAEQRRRLEAYDWPGNVRELQNVVEQGVILAGGGSLGVEHLRLHAPASTDTAQLTPQPLTLDALPRLERRIIEDSLERCSGKIYGRDGAAALLGLKPTTLYSRMKKLGIPRPPKSWAGSR